jgi:predicted nucleic acid-binding protein
LKSVFLDINIILDIFLKREPYYTASAQVFSLVENKKFDGYLCALSYPTLFYLLKKELNREKAMKVLERLRIVLKTAPTIEKVIDLALSSEFRDFEDAVQYYSALEVKCDFLITRNKNDFPSKILPIFTPDEFLVLLNSDKTVKSKYGL